MPISRSLGYHSILLDKWMVNIASIFYGGSLIGITITHSLGFMGKVPMQATLFGLCPSFSSNSFKAPCKGAREYPFSNACDLCSFGGNHAQIFKFEGRLENLGKGHKCMQEIAMQRR